MNRAVRALSVSVAALCFTALPGLAFDVIECDGDAQFGNSGYTLGWAQPTASSIASVVVHDGGFPGSTITGPTAAAQIVAGVQLWNGISSSNLANPTPSVTTISLARLETNLTTSNSERIVYPIDELTELPNFPGLVGWTGLFPTIDVTTTLAITGTRIDQTTQLITDADVLFNDHTSLSMNTFFGGGEGNAVSGFDIATVMGHEWGHALGAEHSLDIPAIMFFVVPPGFTQGLVEDDLNFARFLYPTGANPVLPDRNSLAFANCTEIATTGEIIVKHASSGPGCSVSPKADSRPWGALLLMLFSLGLLAVRRQR